MQVESLQGPQQNKEWYSAAPRCDFEFKNVNVKCYGAEKEPTCLVVPHLWICYVKKLVTIMCVDDAFHPQFDAK